MSIFKLYRITMLSLWSLLAVVWSPSSFAITQSELEQLTPQQAYEKGKLLSWQYKYDESNQYLKYAADKGDADAAIIYASNVRGNALIMKPEEYKYVIVAAEKNQPFGLLKAASNRNYQGKKDREYWRQKALTYFNKKIQAGDVGALFYKASLIPDENDKLNWIERAAKAGFPQAQYYMAEYYKNGNGTFYIPGKREKEIKRLYKEAAEAGYPPAISDYGYLLRSEGLKKEGWEWVVKRANTGDAEAILEVADIYSAMYKPLDSVPQDKVKSAGYFKVYYQSMNVDINDDKQSAYYEDYQKLLSTMTGEEKAQADKFAKDFLATHTVRAFDGFWQWGVDYGIKPSQ